MAQREQPSTFPINGPASQAPNGFGIQIYGEQCKVQIILTAQNEYDAIELFDSLVKGARQGSLNLGAIAKASP
jgi:hypothetical protein